MPRRVALRTAAWAAAGGRKVAAETPREETRAGARPGADADAVFVRRARRAGGPGRDARRGFGVGVWGGEQKSTWADLENQKPVFFQHPSLSLTSVVLSRLPASWSGNLKNHGLPAPRVHREALRPGGASRAAQHPGTGAGGGGGAGIRLHGWPRWSQTCDGSLSSGRHRAGHSTCLSLVLTTGRALLWNRHCTEAERALDPG